MNIAVFIFCFIIGFVGLADVAGFLYVGIHFSILLFFLFQFLLHQLGIFVETLMCLFQFLFKLKRLTMTFTDLGERLLILINDTLTTLNAFTEVLTTDNIIHNVFKTFTEQRLVNRNIGKAKGFTGIGHLPANSTEQGALVFLGLYILLCSKLKVNATDIHRQPTGL